MLCIAHVPCCDKLSVLKVLNYKIICFSKCQLLPSTFELKSVTCVSYDTIFNTNYCFQHFRKKQDDIKTHLSVLQFISFCLPAIKILTLTICSEVLA